MSKKLLILTLGTGSLLTPEAGYQPTKYEINGELFKKGGEVSPTNFVAEPLVDSFNPDEIVILGTVRSVWHILYDAVSGKRDEAYKHLYDIECTNGYKTNSEQLKKYSDEITEIFVNLLKESGGKSSVFSSGRKKPGIHILLMKYGIKEEELAENYSILKGIENILDVSQEYEVAFDITHSFRSLPIYNLIIFNYIKNITQQNIKISHIYYGNVDIRREYNETAPIVDLVRLAKVMDLTGGVAEFKDTGNAVTILNMMEDDEFKEQLEAFDFSTQVNSFDQIKDGIIKLLKLTESEEENSVFTGIREMIRMVLLEKFFEGIPEGDISSLDDITWKVLLTKWYFNQNRFGLGLATGLEALRDINTPIFASKRQITIVDSNNEMVRKNAEEYFVTIAEKINKKSTKNELEAIVCQLGLNFREYKRIRNVFAHSLESDPALQLLTIKNEVCQFKKDFFHLWELIQKNRTAYEELFKKELSSNSGTLPQSNRCRIVLNLKGDPDYNKYKQSQSGFYDVYSMNSNVRTWFKDGIENEKTRTTVAYFLYRYLRNQINGILNGYTKIQIILFSSDPISPDLFVVLKIFLEQLQDEFEDILIVDKDGILYRREGILINLEKYENKFTDENESYAEYSVKITDDLVRQV